MHGKRKNGNPAGHLGLAGLTFAVTAGASEIQLLPAGEFRARDGRPDGVAAWRVDAKIAQRLIAEFHQRVNPTVIDYEHQTFRAEKNGLPAPAAGWFSRLEWREGVGLFAVDVAWTEKARAHIQAGEYKFISPVIQWNRKTGEVTDVVNAALVNFPAIDGMAEVEAALFQMSQHTTPQQEETMTEEQLALLGLKPDATPEQITAALTAWQGKVKAAEESAAALKQEHDPAKFVPVEALKQVQTELAALKAKADADEVAALVSEGLKSGRLLPALETWARGLGAEPLRAYLKDAPALGDQLARGQTGGKPPEGGKAALSEAQVALCRQMGVSQEDFLKSQDELKNRKEGC